jgi:hypothetical protein
MVTVARAWDMIGARDTGLIAVVVGLVRERHETTPTSPKASVTSTAEANATGLESDHRRDPDSQQGRRRAPDHTSPRAHQAAPHSAPPSIGHEHLAAADDAPASRGASRGNRALLGGGHAVKATLDHRARVRRSARLLQYGAADTFALAERSGHDFNVAGPTAHCLYRTTPATIAEAPPVPPSGFCDRADAQSRRCARRAPTSPFASPG